MEVVEISLEDEPGRARYDALFEACPDALIQQSSYWAEAIHTLGPDRPSLLLCRQGGQDVAGLPVYLFEGRLGNILTSVPQPGPLGGVFVRPGLAPEQIESAYRALLARALEKARASDCLTLTLISNPFKPDLALYQRHLQPDWVLENFTQYIPVGEAVSGDALALPDSLRRSNLSRNLKKARREGFSLEITTDRSALSEWYAVHRERHTALGAKPLELALLSRVLERLASRDKARLFLVKAGGDIASGCLCVYHREVLDVYMLSVARRFADKAPNFLNTEQSLLWSHRRGLRIYNWQSSPGREHGVYRYKRQWGSREAPYAFVTRRVAELSRIEAIRREDLASDYRNHYVVPLGVYQHGFETRLFHK